MRLRPLAALSAVAAATLILAGCAGSDPEVEPDATGAASDSLCEAAAPSGEASDGVTVEGEFGAASTASFELGQSVDEVQRTVITEGEGDELAAGEWVSYALSAFDADSGDRLGDAGYVDGELLPAQLTSTSSLSQIIGCAPVGSRLSVVLPGSAEVPAQFYVVDVLDTVPTAAWGEAKEPVEGAPVVSLDGEGAPTVEIPDAEAPADVQISVLKEGDGIEVGAGDTTLLQYHGVDWATGESFDSSWANGAPISIQGNTYVEGFVEALDGQKVGSQVLVTMPPSKAYGEEGSDHELAGQTLVFVIDILATQHPVG